MELKQTDFSVRIKQNADIKNIRLKIPRGYTGLNYGELSRANQVHLPFLLMTRPWKHGIEFLQVQGISLAEYLQLNLSNDNFLYLAGYFALMQQEIRRMHFHEDHICFDLEYIFIDPATNRIQLMLLPSASFYPNSTFYTAFLKIIAVYQECHPYQSWVPASIHLQQMLLEQRNLDFEAVLRYIEGQSKSVYFTLRFASGKNFNGLLASGPEKSGSVPPPFTKDPARALVNVFSVDNCAQVLENAFPEQNPLGFNSSSTSYASSSGIQEEDETVLLSAEESGIAPKAYGTLIRKRNGETVQIFSEEFRVGKSKSSHYCIADNKAVSREHALIFRDENRTGIRDLGSKNGTFVNGLKIGSRQDSALHDGDEIILANESFIFHTEEEAK